MSLSKCQHRGCKAVPEADLRKAFSALLMCAERGAVCSKQRDAGCELQESEFCSVHGVVQELLGLQEGPAGGLAHLPGGAQEATCHKHWDTACERAVREDVENGFCTSDASVKEPLGPQGTSASGNALHGILRRLPGKRFWSHPTLILVLILLLFLVLILVVALAVLSARHVPVAATPPPSVLGCPCGWVGHCGVCYYFSKDHGTWEQGQQRCSELGASLAVVKDEEMDLLFRLSGNVDYWLGLRRRGERLQWRDGSNFSSSLPVLGNSECVYLADKKFRSDSCSNRQPHLCSKAQAPL